MKWRLTGDNTSTSCQNVYVCLTSPWDDHDFLWSVSSLILLMYISTSTCHLLFLLLWSVEYLLANFKMNHRLFDEEKWRYFFSSQGSFYLSSSNSCGLELFQPLIFSTPWKRLKSPFDLLPCILILFSFILFWFFPRFSYFIRLSGSRNSCCATVVTPWATSMRRAHSSWRKSGSKQINMVSLRQSALTAGDPNQR